ncbi:hypothetical protein [Burkholderia stagnalis]|uniref:hypothetical protein n=1 Tax=Burkholderia stagnalis TaxID=1503054 RepID=UPI000F7FF917|nr:hypothetical protein [Burkholderia stagnalis]
MADSLVPKCIKGRTRWDHHSRDGINQLLERFRIGEVLMHDDINATLSRKDHKTIPESKAGFRSQVRV